MKADDLHVHSAETSLFDSRTKQSRLIAVTQAETLQ
jgi:hypothetical protein